MNRFNAADQDTFDMALLNEKEQGSFAKLQAREQSGVWRDEGEPPDYEEGRKNLYEKLKSQATRPEMKEDAESRSKQGAQINLAPPPGRGDVTDQGDEESYSKPPNDQPKSYLQRVMEPGKKFAQRTEDRGSKYEQTPSLVGKHLVGEQPREAMSSETKPMRALGLGAARLPEDVLRGAGRLAAVTIDLPLSTVSTVNEVLNKVPSTIAKKFAKGSYEDIKGLVKKTMNPEEQAQLKKFSDQYLIPTAVKATKWFSGFIKEHPELAANLGAAGHIVDLAGVKVAGSLVKGGLNVGREYMGRSVRNIGGRMLKPKIVDKKRTLKMVDAADLRLREKMNKAARKIGGITLADEERAVASAVPSGTWGRVEKLMGAVPQFASVMAKVKQGKMDDAVRTLKEIVGGKLDNITDDMATAIAKGLDADTQQAKRVFRDEYERIISKGSAAYIDSKGRADRIAKKWAKTRRPENLRKLNSRLANEIDHLLDSYRTAGENINLRRKKRSPIPEEFKGYMGKMPEDLARKNDPGFAAGWVGENYQNYRDLQTEVWRRKKKLWEDFADGKATENKYAAQMLDDVYSSMKAAEYKHLKILGGNKLVSDLKRLDKTYASETGVIATLRNSLGLGKDFGEKGFKEADAIVESLLNKGKGTQFKHALNYMGEDTKAVVRQAAIAKVFRAGMDFDIVDGEPHLTRILVGRMRDSYKKNRPLLSKLSTPEQVKLMDDYMIFLNRAQMGEVKLDNPWNASNTAGASFVTSGLGALTLLGGVGATMGIDIAAPLVIAGPTLMMGGRILAKMNAKMALSAGDKAFLLSMPIFLGATAGYVFGDDDEKWSSAGVGAGVGAVAGLGLATGKAAIAATKAVAKGAKVVARPKAVKAIASTAKKYPTEAGGVLVAPSGSLLGSQAKGKKKLKDIGTSTRGSVSPKRKSYVSIDVNSDDYLDEFGDMAKGEDYNLIEKVWIDPSERKKGVARSMMEKEISKIDNDLPIRLSADPQEGSISQEALIGFYESMGFVLEDAPEGMHGVPMVLKNKNYLRTKDARRGSTVGAGKLKDIGK